MFLRISIFVRLSKNTHFILSFSCNLFSQNIFNSYKDSDLYFKENLDPDVLKISSEKRNSTINLFL